MQKVEEIGLPSIQPDAPWYVTAVVGRSSEGPVLLLEGPEEKCVIGVTWPIHPDVARKTVCNREGDIRQGVFHLEI